MANKPRPLPFRWIEAWREDPQLPPGVRCVLYALAVYMDGQGVAWPAVTTLGRDTGYSRRQVVRHLKRAELAGWLHYEKENGPVARGGRVNLYRIRFALAGEGKEPKDPEERRGDTGDTTSGGGDMGDTPSGRGDTGAGRGDMGAGSGDAGDTQNAHERSFNAHAKAKATDFAGEIAASLHEVENVIKWGSAIALKSVVNLPRFTVEEAEWLLRGIKRSKELARGDVELHADETMERLTARTLCDMRKPDKGQADERFWSRGFFLAWIEGAGDIRMQKDREGFAWYRRHVREAWPLLEEVVAE